MKQQSAHDWIDSISVQGKYIKKDKYICYATSMESDAPDGNGNGPERKATAGLSRSRCVKPSPLLVTRQKPTTVAGVLVIPRPSYLCVLQFVIV